jgi:hypothetical protein
MTGTEARTEDTEGTEDHLGANPMRDAGRWRESKIRCGVLLILRGLRVLRASLFRGRNTDACFRLRCRESRSNLGRFLNVG